MPSCVGVPQAMRYEQASIAQWWRMRIPEPTNNIVTSLADWRLWEPERSNRTYATWSGLFYGATQIDYVDFEKDGTVNWKAFQPWTYDEVLQKTEGSHGQWQPQHAWHSGRLPLVPRAQTKKPWGRCLTIMRWFAKICCVLREQPYPPHMWKKSLKIPRNGSQIPINSYGQFYSGQPMLCVSDRAKHPEQCNQAE